MVSFIWSRLDPEGLRAVNARWCGRRRDSLRMRAFLLSVARDLLDVVHQAEEIPLRATLALPLSVKRFMRLW